MKGSLGRTLIVYRRGMSVGRSITILAMFSAIAASVAAACVGDEPSAGGGPDAGSDGNGGGADALSGPDTAQTEAGVDSAVAETSTEDASDAGCNPDAACAKQVVAVVGNQAACAVLSGGTVWCWGDNQFEELATGHNDDEPTNCVSNGKSFPCRHKPMPVPLLDNVIDACAGEFYICVLRRDKTVWCWGRNDVDQLGHASGSGSDVVRIDPTLSDAGTVFCNPFPSQVQSLSDVAQISCGAGEVCARTSTGDVYCWGENTHGVLGVAPSAPSASALKIASLPTGPDAGAIEIAVDVSGAPHACALMADSTVWCWGGQGYGGYTYGALGHPHAGVDTTAGPNTFNPTALQVKTSEVKTSADAGGPAFDGVVRLVAGVNNNCVLRTDKTVWCWGRNDAAYLGNGSSDNGAENPTPVQASLGNSIARLDAVGAAANANGDVYTWGINLIIADSPTTTCGGYACKPTPAIVGALAGLKVRISDGDTAFGFASNAVSAWGFNNMDQLGHVQSSDNTCLGSYFCYLTPLPVAGLPPP
jgi:alpha-tubulin suppressor-like RCC1 family protein